MTTPTVVIQRHTVLTPELRHAIGDLYAQVRADLLDHPNYQLDIFLERLDRHAAANPDGPSSSPPLPTAPPPATPTPTPSAPATGGGSA